MSEKRTRISLAQKLDIIEAWKKSGFSIEDVMKKYGLKKSTVYRLLAEKEKYTQQELNTPSSNRVKPVYSSKTPSKANIELEKRTYPLHGSWKPTSVNSKNKATFIMKTFWEL